MRMQNLGFVTPTVPGILQGPKIRNVGHVIQATLSYDLVLYFLISTYWSQLGLQILALQKPQS